MNSRDFARFQMFRNEFYTLSTATREKEMKNDTHGRDFGILLEGAGFFVKLKRVSTAQRAFAS